MDFPKQQYGGNPEKYGEIPKRRGIRAGANLLL